MATRGEQRPLSVAPMMDHTDRHLRWVLRQISRRTLLYTEMVTGEAIRHGDRERLLGFDPEERPLALQLGGDQPALLATCARLAQDLGYDEVNLNVGCPSDRVQSGCFGAILMRDPHRVAQIVAAIRAETSIPVTVKHRIGVDGLEAYEDLLRFVDVVADAGADRFVVHARIAVLAGLSPKQNREVPPLRYGDVYRLKRDRPHLWIEMNGGVRSIDEAREHLAWTDGVMIGRAVLEAPMLLAEADRLVFGDDAPPIDRQTLVARLVHYIDAQTPAFRPRWVHRHLSALFAGVPGARVWRRTLSEHADDPRAVERAYAAVVQEAGRDRGPTLRPSP